MLALPSPYHVKSARVFLGSCRIVTVTGEGAIDPIPERQDPRHAVRCPVPHRIRGCLRTLSCTCVRGWTSLSRLKPYRPSECNLPPYALQAPHACKTHRRNHACKTHVRTHAGARTTVPRPPTRRGHTMHSLGVRRALRYYAAPLYSARLRRGKSPRTS